MSDKFFLDTNIFVYSFDSRDKPKQTKAQQLIENSLHSGLGVISHQVVHEFLNVALRKFQNPFTLAEAQSYISHVLHPLCQVPSTFVIIESALLIKARYKFHYYDSLIIAAALEANCRVLYSEDFSAGMQVERLQVINPFL